MATNQLNFAKCLGAVKLTSPPALCLPSVSRARSDLINFLFLSCAGLWQLVAFSCGFCKKKRKEERDTHQFILFLAVEHRFGCWLQLTCSPKSKWKCLDEPLMDALRTPEARPMQRDCFTPQTQRTGCNKVHSSGHLVSLLISDD